MKKWKKIVVKVGTTTLVHPGGHLNIRHMERLVKVLSDLSNAGYQVILVSSGAISMGVGRLGLRHKPADMAGKQACAAVGQCELMYVYDKLFTEYNHTVAQILLTGEDLKDAKRRKSFQTTLNKLLEMNVLPVINENDTMSTAEITSIGDNDTLAAITAVTSSADLLVLLSDIDGLYTEDPNRNPEARFINQVNNIDETIWKLAGNTAGDQGTGGMYTKINAAEICLKHNIDMIIANGSTPDSLYDILEGRKIGTLFTKGESEHESA